MPDYTRAVRPILTWAQHHRRHQPNPLSTSEGHLYVLDETDQPEGLLYCRRCDSYVQPREQ